MAAVPNNENRRVAIRRVDPMAEGNRFDEFTVQFPIEVDHDTISSLWRELRAWSRSGATNLLRAGTTETDIDGFTLTRVNNLGVTARQDSVSEINEEVANYPGEVYLFRVGITNGGGLNAAIGAAEADDVLNELKLNLQMVMAQEFRLGDAEVTLLADGPAMIVLTKSMRPKPDLFNPGQGFDRSQLLASILTSTSTTLTTTLQQKNQSSQLCQPELVELRSDYESIIRSDIENKDSLPRSIRMTDESGFFDLVRDEFGFADANETVTERRNVRGFDFLGRGYASITSRGFVPYGYPEQRANYLIAKMVQAGLSYGVAVSFYNRFGQFARDELTGGLGRVNREDFIEYEIENASSDYQAVYVELDVGNLGALNQAVGLEHADQIFAEIATLCRLRLEQSGLEANMIRHGGDEFSFVGRVPIERISEFTEAIADLQPLISQYIDHLPEFEQHLGTRFRVAELEHPKEVKHRAQYVAKHSKHDLKSYRPIRSKGVGVTVAWSRIDSKDTSSAADVIAEVSAEIEVNKKKGHSIKPQRGSRRRHGRHPSFSDNPVKPDVYALRRPGALPLIPGPHERSQARHY